MPPNATIRLVDAALNRAGEGLRVVEDYARFVLDDRHLTELAKSLRHDLTAAAATLDLGARRAMRDTPGDVGTRVSTDAEASRIDTWEVSEASFKRAQQALRSLEEYGKLLDDNFAAQIEALRYRAYTLEKSFHTHVDSCARLADTRLMVLVDGGAGEAEFVKLATTLVAAGVDAIQLREKNLPDRELLNRARRLTEIARSGQTLSIINDRPDIAALAGADGVHLGQDDMRPGDARRIVGPRMLIGLSTHSLDDVHAAVEQGANYLGAGPTFPSTTKEFAEFPGVAYLREVARATSLPVFAIGGINRENLDEVLDAGIQRIAVSSAVTSTDDPPAAVIRLREYLTGVATSH